MAVYRQKDLARNRLAGSTQIQFVGYISVEEALDPNRLNHKMYNFILSSIRDQDQLSTKLLERLLLGPQKIWEEKIQKSIFDLFKLWDLNEIDDEYLKYKKNIVGWTKKLEHITDRLDDDSMRRLISVSVSMWKTRGTEDSIVDFLSFILKTRVRMFNWFDTRWVLGENSLTLNNDGQDIIWLENPIDGALDHYYSYLKVVDNGIDRTLTEHFVRLMRAFGERIQITYLLFMDLFEIEGDVSQWQGLNGLITVADNVAKMTNTTTTEFMKLSLEESLLWDAFTIGIKFRSEAERTGRFSTWLVSNPLNDNGYEIWIDPVTNEVGLTLHDNPTSTDLITTDYTPWGNIYPGIYQYLSVSLERGETNYIFSVSLNGNHMFNYTTSSINHTIGNIALNHHVDAILDVDEVEVMYLPSEQVLIDINS